MTTGRFYKTIGPEMIDYSGHLNVGFYPLIFEEAAVYFTDGIGLGSDYRRLTEHALFVTEMHLTFEREVLAGDTVEIEWRVLGVGRKAFNAIYLMRRKGSDVIHSTNETLYLHVNLQSRKAAEFPPAEKNKLECLRQETGGADIPLQVGRRILLRP